MFGDDKDNAGLPVTQLARVPDIGNALNSVALVQTLHDAIPKDDKGVRILEDSEKHHSDCASLGSMRKIATPLQLSKFHMSA